MGTGVSASYGFTGTVNYAQFAALANPDPFTGTECRATAGGGTRQAVVASGAARVHNTLHTVSGATLSLSENTSGLTRIDLICLYVDWTANSGAGDASLVAVTGTPSASPSAPYGALSSTPGTAWHEPISEFTVASGAGVLTNANTFDVRTGPWIGLPVSSPWSNYGSGYQTLGGRRSADGAVQLHGLVKMTGSLTSPVSQTITTLRGRWRPTNILPPFSCVAHHGDGVYGRSERVDVKPTGEVHPSWPVVTASKTRWYALNITYTTLAS